jgi:hypothetical protein
MTRLPAAGRDETDFHRLLGRPRRGRLFVICTTFSINKFRQKTGLPAGNLAGGQARRGEMLSTNKYKEQKLGTRKKRKNGFTQMRYMAPEGRNVGEEQ